MNSSFLRSPQGENDAELALDHHHIDESDCRHDDDDDDDDNNKTDSDSVADDDDGIHDCNGEEDNEARALLALAVVVVPARRSLCKRILFSGVDTQYYVHLLVALFRLHSFLDSKIL